MREVIVQSSAHQDEARPWLGWVVPHCKDVGSAIASGLRIAAAQRPSDGVAVTIRVSHG